MVAFLAFISATSVFGTPLIMLPFNAPRGLVYRHIGHISSIQKQTFYSFLYSFAPKKTTAVTRLELSNYGKGWFSLATESESEIVSGVIKAGL